MSTIRAAALPSQFLGIAAPLFLRSWRRIASWTFSFFVPATIFVPHSTVTGLSVLSLTVTQGMPKHVVSSWMPPESVTTIAACFIKQRKSRYPKGSVSMTPAPVFPGASASPRDLAASGPAGRSRPKSLMRCRVRGWTGNMMGKSFANSSKPARMLRKPSRLSTFDGRCRVSSAYGRIDLPFFMGPDLSPNFSQIADSSALSLKARRESIIVLPTRCTQSSEIPSLCKF